VSAVVEPALRHFVISPTDLVYLYDECAACFHSAYRLGRKRPTTFSPHFTNADRAMRRALDTEAIVDLGVGPRFRVHSQGVRVESQPVAFPEHGVSLSVAGKYDALVVTEHDEIFVVDLKTTTQDDGALFKFRRQLASYAFALERPLRRPPTGPVAVDGLALLIFDPARYIFKREAKISGLYGPTRWVELPRDDKKFDKLLTSVAELLGGDEPLPDPTCRYCAFRDGRIKVAGPPVA